MKHVPVLHIDQFPEEQEGFYANDFSSHQQQYHRFITKAHKHDFYLTVLFTRGEGSHEIDFQTYTVKKGSVFLMQPGQAHQWHLSDDAEGIIFFHSKEFYQRMYAGRSMEDFAFFSSWQSTPDLYLHEEQQTRLIPFFRELLLEYRSQQVLKYQKLGSLTNIIYIELSRAYEQLPQKTKAHNSYARKLQELEQLIDKHYVEEKSPAAYASRLHISTKHLNRITQSMLGKTTTELITDRIFLEARRILLHADISMAEAAGLLGYDDADYFSRLFKKKTGKTPSGFLKQYNS